jgi:soluble lytic murein transglycosylase
MTLRPYTARRHRKALASLSSIAAIAITIISAPAAAQSMAPPRPAASPDGGAIANAVYQWKALQKGSFTFSSYASFMIANPGWPGEKDMRAAAEKAIVPDSENPRQVIAFFTKFAPQSPTTLLRYAEALSSDGQTDSARTTAKAAWIAGALTPEDEARLMSRFGSVLTPEDHDKRMDRLLWSRSTTTAARQIAMITSSRKPVFAARLAMLTKAPDAAAKMASVDGSARGDAGYLADKIWWYRNAGNPAMSRVVLSNPRQLAAPPSSPAKWLEIQLDVAKNAANDQQWETVWNIARQVGDTYLPGTVVRDRGFDERDDYTSLTWLGGITSLNKRNRPLDALQMFELYAAAARSPQTQAKGLYWSGRAADAAGQRDRAIALYERAATHYDQFHGQLAAERLGRPVTIPDQTRTIALSSAERAAFESRSVIRAAVWLGSTGQRQDQTRFIRTIAANLNTDADHFLASELAVRLGRQDLGLLVGRSAREDGFTDYTKVAFPTMTVPPEHRQSWTMIHAITRQESQFDREAMSPVGARGLMQLMPGTARETAPSAGVSYSLEGLTQDTQSNIRLGSTYFSQMMDRFGGSYVLAVAAYNAGPGRVNQWLRANGDPRLPNADVVGWIEAIPISETRGYVQRVLENAVVYDRLNPNRTAQTRLAGYLKPGTPSYGGQ